MSADGGPSSPRVVITESGSRLQGWEQYPQKLNELDPITEGIDECVENFAEERTRLFSEGNSPMDTLDIVEYEDGGHQIMANIIANSSKLEEHLNNQTPAHPLLDVSRDADPTGRTNQPKKFPRTSILRTKIITIHRMNSWSRLMISEEAMRKLLTYYQVFPDFVNVLKKFGKKQNYSEQHFGAFSGKIGNKGLSGELCYCIKFMERHNRDLPDPWSVRQMGIYHQSKDSEIWILLQPSTRAKSRLKRWTEALKAGKKDNHANAYPFRLHLLMISAANSTWEEYILYLENEFASLSNKILSSDFELPTNEKPDFPIDDADSQSLYCFESKICKLAAILESNTKTIDCLRKYHERLRCFDARGDAEMHQEFSSLLRYYHDEHERYKGMVKLLLRRVPRVEELLGRILQFRRDQRANKTQEMMREIAENGRRESCLMLELTEEMRRDSGSMRTITLMTLIYLPATFIATLFQMDFIQVQLPEKGGNSTETTIVVSNKFWVYFVVAVPLTAVTLGIWLFWERQQRNGMQRRRGFLLP